MKLNHDKISCIKLVHLLYLYLIIYIYKYGPSHHQHISVTLATIIVVSYNKNTISAHIIVQKCMIKPLTIAFDILKGILRS